MVVSLPLELQQYIIHLSVFKAYVHHSVSIQCRVTLEMSVVGGGYYPSEFLMFLNPSGASPHTSTKFLPRL